MGDRERDFLRFIDLRPTVMSALSVFGFKSISREQRIEIRPLTILAGANSSGKSSFIQPLLLLKQTLNATYDPGPLKLDGPNVSFSSIHQILSRSGSRKGVDSFGVTIEMPERRSLCTVFKTGEHGGFVVDQTDLVDGDERRSLREGMSQTEISQLIPAEKRENDLERGGFCWQVVRNGFMFNLALVSQEDPLLIVSHAFPQSGVWQYLISNLIHVPGIRGNPERTYGRTAVGGVFSGTFEPYVASIVHSWQSQTSDSLQRLNGYLQRLGLSQQVSARQVNDTNFKILVPRRPERRPGDTRDLVNIADVGFGVSQILPVLVALLAAEPEGTVYLEQPELHLHPKAQRALAWVLADAAKRGVRVIAETHSSLLLEGIQTLVAKGELDPSLVKLHWFHRNPKTGFSTVKSADLDENGAFGDWPVDFDEVALESEGDYLDAVEKRMLS